MADVPIVDQRSKKIIGYLSYCDECKPGDQAPVGYNDWFEWAEVQYKAGLRQSLCNKCEKWNFPQEIASEKYEKQIFYRTKREATNEINPIEAIVRVVECKECAAKTSTVPIGQIREGTEGRIMATFEFDRFEAWIRSRASGCMDDAEIDELLKCEFDISGSGELEYENTVVQAQREAWKAALVQ